MGARYIWAQHELSTIYNMDVRSKSSILCGSGTWYIYGTSTKPTFNSSTGMFTFKGPFGKSSNSLSAGNYRYVFVTSASLSTSLSSYDWVDYCDAGSSSSGCTWTMTLSGFNMVMYLYSSSSSKSFNWYTSGLPEYSKGQFHGYVSSSSPSKYPNDGSDNSRTYYYVAETHDFVDPVSVNLESPIVHASSVTASITQSDDAKSNKYGILKYAFGYCFDSSSWTDLSPTIAVSQSISILDGKKTLQVRAKVQDDIGFISDDYVLSEVSNIYASYPPSTPEYIHVSHSIAGWEATIESGESYDKDDTSLTYVFERKIDSGEWMQIQSSQSRFCNDMIQDDWTSMEYRVHVVDSSGTSSGYVESGAILVKKDIIMILGPKDTDFGFRFGPFMFEVSAIASTEDKTSKIHISADLDSTTSIYSEDIEQNSIARITVNVHSLQSGSHTIVVSASKEGFTTVSETYEFKVQDLVVPESGTVVQFQDSTGKVIAPETVSSAIFTSDGRTLDVVLNEIMQKING